MNISRGGNFFLSLSVDTLSISKWLFFSPIYDGLVLQSRICWMYMFGVNYLYFRGIKHLDTLPETSPRMIKSHLPYCLLPEQLKSGKGKVLYFVVFNNVL